MSWQLGVEVRNVKSSPKCTSLPRTENGSEMSLGCEWTVESCPWKEGASAGARQAFPSCHATPCGPFWSCRSGLERGIAVYGRSACVYGTGNRVNHFCWRASVCIAEAAHLLWLGDPAEHGLKTPFPAPADARARRLAPVKTSPLALFWFSQHFSTLVLCFVVNTFMCSVSFSFILRFFFSP